jgi:hypothetical protein
LSADGKSVDSFDREKRSNGSISMAVAKFLGDVQRIAMASCGFVKLNHHIANSAMNIWINDPYEAKYAGREALREFAWPARR